MKRIFNIFLISSIFFSIYISYNVLISFRYQFIFREDQLSSSFSFTSEEMSNIPSIPNVGVTTIPIDALKSNYFFKEGFSKEANLLLDSGAKKNPYIFFSEYTKARFFVYSKQFDSAHFYAKKAFYGWPKYIEHYKLYNNTLVQRRDTLEILNAYDTINKYFNDRTPYYDDFLNSLSNAKLRYLITQYDSLSSVDPFILDGSWSQVYQFESGETIKLNNSIIFENNTFSNASSSYNYELKSDTINIIFKSSNKSVAKYPIYYSKKYETLILKDVPKQINMDSIYIQDQFFKKIE
tara:strand:+ start:1393 stop:2274 length:882 start_codon:yes stop_codon:yes gene_type:complete